jgi:hypothetical protein
LGAFEPYLNPNSGRLDPVSGQKGALARQILISLPFRLIEEGLIFNKLQAPQRAFFKLFIAAIFRIGSKPLSLPFAKEVAFFSKRLILFFF